MGRAQYRALHKWIFIFMGAFILIWCISGILMVLPQDWTGGTVRLSKPAVDYRKIAISPAEAVRLLEAHTGGDLNIRNIQLQQIHNHLVYQIRARDSGTRYIDGFTGEYFEYTPQLAEEMARNAYKINSPVIELTRITEHDISFPFGHLPAYRIRFENEPDINYFVIENNARIRRSTRTSVMNGIITSLHTLDPVEHITQSKFTRDAVLVLTSGLTVLGAILGYILTLPARRISKQTIS